MRIRLNMKINEIFLSIQGEGLQIGVPTLFIRAAGCDLRCIWCDTPYALLESQGTDWDVERVIGEVEKRGCRHVCITGGDPLMQKEECIDLVRRLIRSRYSVVLETSGAYSLEGLPESELLVVSMDLKLPGSGMEQRNMLDNVGRLHAWDQLKFIIADERDYMRACELMDELDIPCEVIMTPVGGREMRWLADRVLMDGINARVLPQLHKFIWGDERGR